MKLIIGLVVKGGAEFIDKWIDTIERMKCDFVVVDNGAHPATQELLLDHPQMVQYHIQKFPDRNQSRDYQKILEMGREEKADWIFNLDSDEIVPEIDMNFLEFNMLNSTGFSIGFPLIEMRNDEEHYVMILENDTTLRDGRLVHKLYKVCSHFEFDKNDTHGCSIPHNCPREKGFIPIFIQHFGHMTKELREEKRNREGHTKDIQEHFNSWLEEDESKITIKSFKELEKRWNDPKLQ